MFAALLTAAVLSASPTQPGVVVAPPQSATPATAPVDLEDILVEGNRLENATEAFVRQVGAPARDRGLARWRNGVCVGVVNLQADAAQFIIDRVSDTARDVGLRVGAPGCTPSVVIIATDKPDELTPAIVNERPRMFRVGGAGMDRGRQALEAFQTSDRPVRWWHVSAPVDEMGNITVRIPGVCFDACDSALDMITITKVQASRLQARTQDDIKQAFVVLDVNKTSNVSLEQLADYIAMVTLAQINPDADTRGYSTILNLFSDPQDTPQMTTWDHAYLTGLYDAQRSLRNTRAARQEVANSIIRARRNLEKRSGEDQSN